MQQLELPLLCNGPARALPVVQDAGPGNDFTFYATFDIDSLRSYIPSGTPVLLPASSWARIGLKKPNIPAQITDTGADCGGFVASRIWGEYRYTLAQYVAWLESWRPRWAATMDYCCEPELSQVTRERQDKTTENARTTMTRFKTASWSWVPTIQGWTPDDYRRHAHELKPLILDMQSYYADNPAWRVGIGTLCHRNDVTTVQAIVSAIREVLPGVPLHLWGIKLDALRSIDLAGVVSSDSAVWHQAMYTGEEIATQAARAGMSGRRYMVTVNLPAYAEKVRQAVTESRRVIAAQNDAELIARARAVLKSQGWTINLRWRRNRQYVYAARRRGSYIEQRSICPVSELAQWLQPPGRDVAQQ